MGAPRGFLEKTMPGTREERKGEERRKSRQKAKHKQAVGGVKESGMGATRSLWLGWGGGRSLRGGLGVVGGLHPATPSASVKQTDD